MAAVNKKKKLRGRQPRWRSLLRPFLYGILISLSLYGLSIFCVAGYHMLLRCPWLRVTAIQVEGCQRVESAAIIEQAKIPPGVNILALDLDDVRQRVASHPWVADVSVIREIPDRVRIVIAERRPFAIVRTGDFYLIDSSGYCFAKVEVAKYPGLPIISGIDTALISRRRRVPPRVLAMIKELHAQCQSGLPWRLISEIVVTSSGGLKLFTLKDGIAINLGKDDYARKMVRLQRVLQYLEEQHIPCRLRAIDLAYRDRVFLRGDFSSAQKLQHERKGV
ncbi:MAG: FtsQ-type POTRA domain-containing protein [Deltaproteobacteria bacterium]|nr:FtsQ-type POTRA domain-containing protein [Deltaproteobacteria bacterium]MBW2071632.1 FtsQ-type POTRA domain-containing protein [Deltaproteobacteria bacterium]